MDMGCISGFVLGPYSNESSTLSFAFSFSISSKTIWEWILGRTGSCTHSGFNNGINTDNPTSKKIIRRSSVPSFINILLIILSVYSPRNERSIPRIIRKEVPITPSATPINNARDPAVVG